MPVSTIRFLLIFSLLASFRLAFGQADLSVNVRIENPYPAADELVFAVIKLKNEGEGSRMGMQVELNLSPALFFVNASSSADFNANTLIWNVPVLLEGGSDSLRISVQPNYGGIHTLGAELIEADKRDWDSRPNNNDPYEDDQDEACLSVPVKVDCGQDLVLNAPKGYDSYSWYKDGDLLAYATSDTLHPSGTGAYTFKVDGGGGCLTGNCCPVLVERTQCEHDLALTIAAAPLQPGQQYQNIQIKLYNQGSGVVSKVSVYVTTSRMMRLKPGTTNWLLNGSIMKTDWTGVLNPGDSSIIDFQIQSISGADPSQYQMFAEIFEFYSGDNALEDADSHPDTDPTNDKLVDDAYQLAASLDEDDSDIANLTDCPIITVSGNKLVCAGEPLLLSATKPIKPVTYQWSGNAQFSCATCSETTVTVTSATDITLTTRTAEGCEQTQKIVVSTENCVKDLQLVVSPYGPTTHCWNLDPGTEIVWCSSPLNEALSTSQSASGSELCSEIITTGEWGGIQDHCLDLCNGLACNRVNLTLIALPKRDVVEGQPGNPICITDFLQVEANPIDVSISPGVSGVSLVANVGGCYSISEPTTSYPAVSFQLVHKYLIAGITLYDTTVVNVPGRQICDFEVFAVDTFEVFANSISKVTSSEELICLNGTSADLANVKFSMSGLNMQSPTGECDPVSKAKYSFKSLPNGYLDNGWRILRYFKGDKIVINNYYASTLDILLNKIQSVDPGSEVTFDNSSSTLFITGYAETPGALQIAHLQTGGRVNERPVFENGYRGTNLAIKEGLAVGNHTVTAVDPNGCRDVAIVKVLEAFELDINRDTIYLDIEVGEPLVVDDLNGKEIQSNKWELIKQDCYVYIPTRTNTIEYYTFTKTTTTQQIETTYAVSIVEQVCTPLVVNKALAVKSATCKAEYFNLGLTRPDISIKSSTGSVITSTVATGSRAGSSYDLTKIPFDGLTSQFEITSWIGFNQAIGKKGNMMEIFRQLRKAGYDARIDWATKIIYAAGSGKGNIVLKDLNDPSKLITLTPVQTSLATYGYFLARPGQNTLTLASPYCSDRMTARVNCQIIVIEQGGVFALQAGVPAALTIDEDILSLSYNQWSIEEAPAKVLASLNVDAKGVVISSDEATSDEILIKACNNEGDCKLVRIKIEVEKEDICDFEIWRPEEVLVTAGISGVAYVTLPAQFERNSTPLTINGKVKKDGFTSRIVSVEQRFEVADAIDIMKLASPFGKTVNVTTSLSEAFMTLYTEASPAKDSDVLVLRDEFGGGKVYAQHSNGIWQPMQPLVQKEESRYQIELEAGEYDLSLSNADGSCSDKLHVIVKPISFNQHQEVLNLQVGTQLEWCLPESDKAELVVEVSNACENLSGERTAIIQTNDCFIIEGFEPGQESICIRRTYMDGSVDSVTLDLRIRAVPTFTVRNDRVKVDAGQFKIIEVLSNDDLLDEPRMISLISEPFFGSAQVVGNSAIEYLHKGSDCVVDVFTYEVCQGDTCKSATVQLDIICEELLVFNGFSPNGDGVNDELTIMGLNNYPKHLITIFSREGELLTSLRDYANDWRGDIAGNPLPSGTYFYVIDLGDGSKTSGYIQLNR